MTDTGVAAVGDLAQIGVLDLTAFRERLVVSRSRLILRIVGEDDPGRALPDTAWVRMAADLHTLILAVDDMIKEDRA